MELENIVKLINTNKEHLIPRDVPYKLVKDAYKNSTRNDYKFAHKLEKQDNENYGYLGVLRLRDIKYTHDYVTRCRTEIIELAKSKPTKLEQVATIYSFLVNNFTINMDYDKAFNVYYKSLRNIYEKSDAEIIQFFEGIREYHHPFKEVIIEGEKYVASTRCDLYETKTSIEGIISEEFLLLCSKVNPSFSIDQTFVRLKDSTKTYNIFSINISEDENQKVFTLFAPTLDILNKQSTGIVEFKHFGISNEQAENQFEYVNALNNDNVEIPQEVKTVTFNNISELELND